MKDLISPRKILRLNNFDYSRIGSYFITICSFENRYLFGKIKNGQMDRSYLGKIIENLWLTIQERFPGVILGEHIVMSNHFHGIIILEGKREATEGQLKREATERLPFAESPMINNRGGSKAAPSVPQIMHWYKTWTSNEYFRYLKTNFPGKGYLKIWHRSYYDHVIRDIPDYERISEYIANNPKRWDADRFSWPANKG